MEVYKIVITVIALIVVTLLSVLAEMLGKAQETRRLTLSSRPMNKQDETTASRGSQTRVDGQQNRESPQADVRAQIGASSHQNR